MIEPNKYMNYKLSVVNVASSIIAVLIDNGASRYIDVMKKVEKKDGENSKYEFQNALNFLFLLGKVNYVSHDDVLELVI